MKSPPWLAAPPAADDHDDFLVVGAGIAGAAAARALAVRGCRVRVLDMQAPSNGASGNPGAVIRPQLARDPNDPLSRFYSAAFKSTVEQFHLLRSEGHAIAGAFEGVLHCHPQSRALRGRAAHEYLDLSSARQRIGDAVQADGQWLPEAGWLSPVDYCKALLSHPCIELLLGQLETLEYDGQSWRLLALDGEQLTGASNVVLANGWRMGQVAPTSSLPIRPVASQLLHFDSDQRFDGPAVPIVGGGSLCPTANGWMATAGHWHNCTEDRVDFTRNAEILLRCSALWRMPIGSESASLRAAVRATSRDYLPMVGAVPDFEQAKIVYSDLHRGRPAHHYPPAPHVPGLYMLGALGGRGMCSAQLCAQVLCSVIFAEEHPWQSALHPLRFLARQLKRGQDAL